MKHLAIMTRIRLLFSEFLKVVTGPNPVLILILTCCVRPLFSQTMLRDTLMERLLYEGRYEQALRTAHREHIGRPTDASLDLKLAECYSLLRQPDSAFIFLNRFVSRSAYPYFVLSNRWLVSLRSADRWKNLYGRLGKQYYEEFAGSRPDTAFVFLEFMNDDQFLRGMLRLLPASDSLKDAFEREDAALRQRFLNYIGQNGIPSCAGMDPVACKALGLMFIHLPWQEQITYRSQIETLYMQNKFDPESYAVFKDKMMVKEEGKQYFGTQSYTDENGTNRLYDIVDPRHVDERRQRCALMPLKEWCRMIGVEYTE
ncbi:MAG TPA: hypothetical protein PLO67_01335 [Saprospiraceae bacterium]|nr:hypothetical protein [Saprospiraceae bacterium]